MAARPLADDLWWLCHDERSGELLLYARSAGVGLAGALLIELWAAGQVMVVGQTVVPVREAVAPADALVHVIAAEVGAEPEPLPVAVWLEFLGSGARARVGERLRLAGLVRREATTPARRWRRRRVERWVVPDVNVPGWVRARLVLAFEDVPDMPGVPRRVLSGQDRALAALVWATGLDGHVFPYADQRGIRHELGELARGLEPAALRELVLGVHAAVARPAMTRT